MTSFCYSLGSLLTHAISCPQHLVLKIRHAFFMASLIFGVSETLRPLSEAPNTRDSDADPDCKDPPSISDLELKRPST